MVGDLRVRDSCILSEGRRSEGMRSESRRSEDRRFEGRAEILLENILGFYMGRGYLRGYVGWRSEGRRSEGGRCE